MMPQAMVGPDDAVGLLRGQSFAWGVAGGWAIDLRLGRTTRTHDDVDIAVLRGQIEDVRAALDGWDLRIAHQGELETWERGRPLPADRHAVWCRASATDPWAFELLVNEHEGGSWVFRRDRSVQRPLAAAFREVNGIPILDPTIVLLYKAKALRDRDVADFEHAIETLSADDAEWLRNGIARAHGEAHPWCSRLGTSRRGSGSARELLTDEPVE